MWSVVWMVSFGIGVRQLTILSSYEGIAEEPSIIARLFPGAICRLTAARGGAAQLFIIPKFAFK